MLSDLEDLTTDFIEEPDGFVTPERLNRAINMAVNQYSKDRNHTETVLLEPISRNLYPLPENWTNGMSQIVNSVVDGDEVYSEITYTIDGQNIKTRYARHEPLILTFKNRHTLTADTSTIPQVDYEAIAAWAASLLLDGIATQKASNTDVTLNADVADFNNQSRSYAMRAGAMRKRYYLHLKEQPGVEKAAGGEVTLAPSRRSIARHIRPEEHLS
jgi:hypothetical protein